MGTTINLYGASGHCKVVLDILLSNNLSVGKIIDDNPKLLSILDCQVEKSAHFVFEESSNWLLSIGNNSVRKTLAQRLSVTFVTAIHPSAILSPYVSIGVGTVVMAGAIVNPDVRIGKHCIINTGSVIEHDCAIEDYVHISPLASLAGGVFVGEGSHVGIGATIIQGVKIGKWVTVGAGAVILKDIPDYATVVGNPGKIIKYNRNE